MDYALWRVSIHNYILLFLRVAEKNEDGEWAYRMVYREKRDTEKGTIQSRGLTVELILHVLQLQTSSSF